MIKIFLVLPFLFSQLFAIDSHLLNQEPAIPFEKIQFPWTYQRFELGETDLVWQGGWQLLSPTNINASKRVFTGPCRPCQAVVLHDPNQKIGILAHIDHFTDPLSLPLLWKKHCPTSNPQDIKVLIFSSKIPCDFYIDLEREYGTNDQATILRTLRETLMNHLEIPKENFSLKLMNQGKKLGYYGKYDNAFHSIGFDIVTGEYFTTSLIEALQRFQQEGLNEEFDMINALAKTSQALGDNRPVVQNGKLGLYRGPRIQKEW